jgi:hypothetical protein
MHINWPTRSLSYQLLIQRSEIKKREAYREAEKKKEKRRENVRYKTSRSSLLDVRPQKLQWNIREKFRGAGYTLGSSRAVYR